jgi:hypothetical protein
MHYIDVKWLHAGPEDPVRLVSELGPDRYETRKIEFFLDGRVGYAPKDAATYYTRLGQAPGPALVEVNVQSEFSAIKISAAEFEDLWDEYVAKRKVRES